MAVSKSTPRTRPGTNPTRESILSCSSISKERRRAWRAVQCQAGESSPLRFPAYRQLYLLNLYTKKIIDLLKEIDDQFGDTNLSNYHQSLVEEVRSQTSQHILESMNGVEITESFLNSQLRKHWEKRL